MLGQLSRFLFFCATHGRWVLVVSLALGLSSQALANLVKPHIDTLIALLLFTTCLRVGPAQALGAIRDIRANLLFTLVLQVATPLAIVLLLWIADLTDPFWLILIVLTAAPAISGGPHLVAMLGHDPTATLRQLVMGTYLLRLTIIPVFALMPEIGSLSDVMAASMRLSMVILGAALGAFAIRHALMKHPAKKQLQQIDGIATILLAVVVLGLMAAIHSEIADTPLNVLRTLAFAVAVNFGLQVITTLILARSHAAKYAAPIGLIAGNRNIALFMTALAVTETQPFLLFIACYQIPMYLTPLLMQRFYQKWGSSVENVH